MNSMIVALVDGGSTRSVMDHQKVELYPMPMDLTSTKTRMLSEKNLESIRDKIMKSRAKLVS